MILDYIIIGKRIKEIRLQNSLTQEKLAEMCNRSVSYISRIETAQRTVSLEVLVNICNKLGVTVDAILKGHQICDVITDKVGLMSIFEDCSCYERQIIYEILVATKKSLRNNKKFDYMSNF